MSLFVLADLHLCQGNPEKTMSIFSGWQDYQERIEKHWLELITECEILPKNRMVDIYEENLELIKIVVASIKTMRNKINKTNMIQ